MRHRKMISILSLVWISCILLTACWNYKEISEKAVVMAVAVDYDKEKDEIIMSTEIAVPTRRGQEMTVDSEVITSAGKNFFDAARNAVGRVGKRMFWSHAKVLIFGKDLIAHEDKLISTLDWFKRDQEVRDDIWVALSMEKTAKEVLTDSEVKLYNIVGLYLEDMIRNRKSISRYNDMPLYQFVDDLAGEGISPTMPTVQLRTYEGSKKSELNGTAVFKKSKLVGWLNTIESKAYLFAIDKMEGGVIVIQDQWNGKPFRVTLEVFKSKTKIEPMMVDDEVVMGLDVQITANIAESDTEVDIFSEEKRMRFQRDAEKKIEKEIQEVIQKVQRKYKSDIFGFGATIQREKPKLWKELKPHWEEIFPHLKTEVNVELDIRGSALRSKPIKVGD